MILLAIVSPAPALRAGLRALITSDPEFKVCGEAAGLDDPAGELTGAAVVVADANSLAGTEWIEQAAARLNAGQALLLLGGWSRIDGEISARDWLDQLTGMGLRAWGMLPPEATAEALQAAVRALAEGLVTAPAELIQAALAAGDSPAHPLERPLDDEPLDRLTGRETDVLRQLAQGLTNKQIALALGISEHTVKFHVSAIYSKLGVSNRLEAVRMGSRKGWIPL